MITAIVGSRTFNDYELMKDKLKDGNITSIVSGGARGADKLAEVYADEMNLFIEVINANWQLYGKAAGAIRNKLIINKVEQVYAFWDGISPGTKDAINLADKSKIPVYVIKGWTPIKNYSWGLDNPLIKRISKVPPLIVKA